MGLHKDTFEILVALADRDRHGYSILQDISARTGGKVRLSPSTLYSAIRRLLEDGLIEELEERPDPKHDDERRRYYRLTDFGQKVLKAEVQRISKMVAVAQKKRLIPKTRS